MFIICDFYSFIHLYISDISIMYPCINSYSCLPVQWSYLLIFKLIASQPSLIFPFFLLHMFSSFDAADFTFFLCKWPKRLYRYLINFKKVPRESISSHNVLVLLFSCFFFSTNDARVHLEFFWVYKGTSNKEALSPTTIFLHSFCFHCPSYWPQPHKRTKR